MTTPLTNSSDLEKLQLIKSDSDDTTEALQLHQHLRASIENDVGPAERQGLCLSLHNDSGQMCAGLRGFSHWHWLYISHLWVMDHCRNQGLAQRLLAEATNVASSRNNVGLYVDTFSNDTAQFYKKNGYKEVGRIENFPPGQNRIFLKKYLALDQISTKVQRPES
jgi:ribosomal protein S18 acetylase RimI-like enzyme